MTEAVAVEGLVRRFGAVTAVDGAGFSVGRGEMFGLIGPDGAGKSTTLRCVLGLLSPDAGRVRVLGLDPWKDHRALARRVGYLPQGFSLYGDLSVDENIAFFARVHEVPASGADGWKRRRDALLEMLRLTEFRRRLADRLSGGMKQKLSLACTLIHTPELLILDEPTAGVDPVSRRDFWKILARLQREGMTVLLTTPYLDEAERCSRVGLMQSGTLLASGTPDAVRGLARGTILEIIARPRPRAREAILRRFRPAGIEVFGERLHATFAELAPAEADRTARAVAEAVAAEGITVESVRPVPPSLEDVFIALARPAESAAGARSPA